MTIFSLKNALVFSVSLVVSVFFAASAGAEISARLGEVGMRYANVSLTDAAASGEKPDVTFEVSKKSDPASSACIKAKFENFNSKSVSAQIGPLDAGTEYVLKISSAGGGKTLEFKTRADWEGRNPPADFELALLGACHDNDKVYDPPFRTPGGGYEVFDSVLKNSPSAVLWLGGFISLRPADLGSYVGYLARYARAEKEYKAAKLLEGAPNMGVMGISAYGDSSDDGRSLCGAYARRAFCDFWPNAFSRDIPGALAYSFKIYDAEFFVLDDCSARDNMAESPSERKMFGKDQMDWLKSSLLKSKAVFKVVVANSPMLNPVERVGHFAGAKNERADLLDFLAKNKIEGVVFFSAGKPYFELTRMVRAGAYELFEVTTGPATARASEKAEELNYFKVPTSTVYSRGFVRVGVSGPEGDRLMQIQICDTAGKPLFKHEIPQKSLKFEK